MTGYIALVMGLSALPAYTFQNHLILRAVQCLVSLIALKTIGGRVRLRGQLILLATITGIHLLTPTGLILTRIGGFSITLGALEVGLNKGLLLIGLIYLSRFVVRSEWLPLGSGDNLVAMVLAHFEGLTARTGGRRPRRDVDDSDDTRGPRSISTLVRWFDTLLFEQIRSREEPVVAEGAAPVPAGGLVAIIVYAVFQWTAFLLPRLVRIPDFVDLF